MELFWTLLKLNSSILIGLAVLCFYWPNCCSFQLGRILAAIFLAMFSVVEGVTWMNYFLVGFTLLPLTLLLSITMEYNRSALDRLHKEEEEEEEDRVIEEKL